MSGDKAARGQDGEAVAAVERDLHRAINSTGEEKDQWIISALEKLKALGGKATIKEPR